MRQHHVHSYKHAARNGEKLKQENQENEQEGQETDYFGMDGFPAGAFNQKAASGEDLLDETLIGDLGQNADAVVDRNKVETGRNGKNPEKSVIPDNGQDKEQDAEFATAVAAAVKKATDDLRLRSAAEMENFKKHLAREHEKQLRYAAGKVMEDLLPTLDNLDLALQYSGDNAACKGIVQGVAMTRKLLLDAVAKHGLKPLGEPGEEFSPAMHESVGFEVNESLAPGHVARVLQRGYMLEDRVLRAARVLITQ